MEQDLDIRLGQAAALMEKDELDNALLIVGDILKDDKTNIKALELKVSILGLFERYKEAVNVMDEALKIDSANHLLWFKRGVSLYHLNNYNDALTSFDTCLKIKPNFHRALGKKISALMLIGRYKEAVKLYEESDLDEDSYKRQFNNIGYTYLELGDYKKAELYLKKAELTDNHEIILYNLAELYKRKKNYLRSIYFFTRAKWRSLFKKDTDIKNQWSVDKFIGPGKLFLVNSQLREIKAILKLFRTPHWAALCNDTFRWFAINIPCNLLGNNGFETDIDIIVNMPKGLPFDEHTPSRYRSFEVKSILIDNKGKAKSLNRGENKRKRIYNKLKLFQGFGSDQVILLEIYGVARGFSDHLTFPTVEVRNEAKNKIDLIKNDGFGYLVIQDEASETIQDGYGGKYYFPMNLLVGQPHEIKSPFKELVEHIGKFYETEIQKRGMSGLLAITYCKKCKELFLINTNDDNPTCYNCGRSIDEIYG